MSKPTTLADLYYAILDRQENPVDDHDAGLNEGLRFAAELVTQYEQSIAERAKELAEETLLWAATIEKLLPMRARDCDTLDDLAAWLRRTAADAAIEKLASLAAQAPDRIQELERICAETYQAVGILADEAGRFDDPAVIKVLDNLSLQKLVHDDALPFPCAQAPAQPVVWPLDIRPPFQVMPGRTLLHIETDAENPLGAGIPVCSVPKNRMVLAEAIVKACNGTAQPSFGASASGSFMTREQAIEFNRKRRPGVEPTEQLIAATIDAYSALFGDMVPADFARPGEVGHE